MLPLIDNQVLDRINSESHLLLSLSLAFLRSVVSLHISDSGNSRSEGMPSASGQQRVVVGRIFGQQ